MFVIVHRKCNEDLHALYSDPDPLDPFALSLSTCIHEPVLLASIISTERITLTSRCPLCVLSTPTTNDKMPPHLNTSKKWKILGAKQFLEYLQTLADEEGKIDISKLGDEEALLAECFGVSKEDVAKIIKEGREGRHFEKNEEKRGGRRLRRRRRSIGIKVASEKSSMNSS